MGSVDPEAFGFFYCNITTPSNLEHPILQRKIKTEDGIRTVAGLGSWTGWVTSIEVDHCKTLGYRFEILNGYKFRTSNIFSEYVNTLYALRLEYPSGTPMNLIAKLFMNSLYGKFGMKSVSSIVEIFQMLSQNYARLSPIIRSLWKI